LHKRALFLHEDYECNRDISVIEYPNVSTWSRRNLLVTH
jgi:hypothetical protein